MTAEREAMGSHPLGAHVWVVIETARGSRHDTTLPAAADAMLEALAQCMDMTSSTPAARPRAASPEKPHFANRTRATHLSPVPMNPVQRHHSTASSRAPGSSRSLDSGYWRHEYLRVNDHFDRCEVVRRAADYLASLLRLNPDQAESRSDGETEKDLRKRIAVEAHGHALRAAAERFDRRSVIQARLEHGHHPIRGVAWTPPEENVFAAREARGMRDEGLTTADIARALGRNASTVRNWTTRARLAA